MNENIFSPEKMKSQEDYSERTKKEAESLNNKRNLIEKVFGKGKINEEDITRIDAELELNARKDTEGKNPKTDESFKYLDRLINSDLFLEETPFKREKDNEFFSQIIKMKGKIKEQDVVLQDEYFSDTKEGKSPFIFVKDENSPNRAGSIDGNEISKQQAMELFLEYVDIAKNRMEAIKKSLS